MLLRLESSTVATRFNDLCGWSPAGELAIEWPRVLSRSPHFLDLPASIVRNKVESFARLLREMLDIGLPSKLLYGGEAQVILFSSGLLRARVASLVE